MASAVNTSGDVERREPDVGPTSNEQPNAPYLEAVVAYAFRGTARYHVPGHKGGPGADPGLRKAIGVDALAADVPQDIHGIDLGASPTPYERAERLAADAIVTSTHKIAGSLTQSAMLHVAGGRIDAGAVGRAVRLLRSTSPSSLLLASLDSARRQLVLHGEQLLHETLEAIEVARAKLLTIDGIALVDASLVGRMGIAGYDPLRIVVDVRGTGRTGYEIADALRRSYDVHLELPTTATLVFIVGLGESVAALRRLAGDIEETVKRVARPGTTAAIVGPRPTVRYDVAV